MARKSAPESLNKTVAFRVVDEIYAVIAAAMHRERRKESDVCRALIARGIAAYNRDKLLFEPEEEPEAKTGRKRKTGWHAA